jgi:hypothetical protein
MNNTIETITFTISNAPYGIVGLVPGPVKHVEYYFYINKKFTTEKERLLQLE